MVLVISSFLLFLIFQLMIEMNIGDRFEQAEIIANEVAIHGLHLRMIADDGLDLVEFGHGIVEFLLFYQDHAFEH